MIDWICDNLSVDLLIRMCMQEWQEIDSPALAYGIHTLDDHLAQTLACSHDIRRIDCFVRTDQYETLRSML